MFNQNPDMPTTSLEDPVVNENLKYHDKHDKAMRYIRWYRGCYEGGLEFSEIKDPRDGSPILIRGSRESDKFYTQRTRQATCLNYCKPIVMRFQSMANFGIVRDRKIYPSYVAEVNKGIRDALITGQALFRMKTKKSNYKENKVFTKQHLADLEAEGALYALQWIDPLYFVNWTDDFSEYVIRIRPDFALMVTPEKVMDIELDPESGHVKNITESDDKPDQFVFCKPTSTGESFIKDVAPLQVDLFNGDSYLSTEISGNTFSSTYIIGASAKQIVGSNKAPIGSDSSKDIVSVEDLAGRKTIFLPAGASVEIKGGDPAQAESIRKSQMQTVAEIYANVGLKSPEASAPGLVESGLALFIKRLDTAVFGQKIAEQLEIFENKALKYFSENSGKPIEPTVYKKESDDSDSAQTAQLLLTAIKEPLIPPTLKEDMAKKLSEIIVNFDSKRKKEFEKELETFYKDKEKEENDGFKKQGAGQPGGPPSVSKVARNGKKAVVGSSESN